MPEGCPCFAESYREWPRRRQRRLRGRDTTNGRYADVTVDTCTRCGSIWLVYEFEFHYTASGRWMRGVIDREQEQIVTAQNAAAMLESLPWYYAGGSYHHGEVYRTSGPIDD